MEAEKKKKKEEERLNLSCDAGLTAEGHSNWRRSKINRGNGRGGLGRDGELDFYARRCDRSRWKIV